MSKHTQGPWERIGNVYGHSRYAVMNKSCVLMAEVVDWPDEEMTIANADLIAAAPTMLEALTGLWEAGNWIWSDDDQAMIYSIKLSAAEHNEYFIDIAKSLSDATPFGSHAAGAAGEG